MHDMLQVRNDKTGNIFIFFPRLSFQYLSMSIKNIESSVILQTFLFHAKVTYLFLYWQFMTEKTLNL